MASASACRCCPRAFSFWTSALASTPSAAAVSPLTSARSRTMLSDFIRRVLASSSSLDGGATYFSPMPAASRSARITESAIVRASIMRSDLIRTFLASRDSPAGGAYAASASACRCCSRISMFRPWSRPVRLGVCGLRGLSAASSACGSPVGSGMTAGMTACGSPVGSGAWSCCSRSSMFRPWSRSVRLGVRGLRGLSAASSACGSPVGSR
ncbi:hypothetical protein T492DRAFT_927101, partial [Pavlovales sp. CCMP2436]